MELIYGTTLVLIKSMHGQNVHKYLESTLSQMQPIDISSFKSFTTVAKVSLKILVKFALTMLNNTVVYL